MGGLEGCLGAVRGIGALLRAKKAKRRDIGLQLAEATVPCVRKLFRLRGPGHPSYDRLLRKAGAPNPLRHP